MGHTGLQVAMTHVQAARCTRNKIITRAFARVPLALRFEGNNLTSSWYLLKLIEFI